MSITHLWNPQKRRVLLEQLSDTWGRLSCLTWDSYIEIPRSRPCSLLSEEGCIYTKWQGDYESSSLLVKPCLLDQGKGWLGSVVWGWILSKGFTCVKCCSNKCILTPTVRWSCAHSHDTHSVSYSWQLLELRLKSRLVWLWCSSSYSTCLPHKALSATTSLFRRWWNFLALRSKWVLSFVLSYPEVTKCIYVSFK